MRHDPFTSITAFDVKFSDAMSSRPRRWRCFSFFMMAAICVCVWGVGTYGGSATRHGGSVRRISTGLRGDGREKKSVGARRVGGGFTTVVKKRLDVGAVPGTRGASRDSHLRVELLDAEILERGRPGAGGGLGDRARGLGACAKIQTVRCDVGKDVALGCSTAARDPGAARRPRRRARKRRAWIVWIDDHDASQRRTHVPAGPVDRPRAAPTVGAARPE